MDTGPSQEKQATALQGRAFGVRKLAAREMAMGYQVGTLLAVNFPTDSPRRRIAEEGGQPHPTLSTLQGVSSALNR